ncbi:MAG TPA: iron export ABC transporter permease subunit FetB [Terriglobales bacterium]|nr:iron export ABC transporter permease subunit FetB [Terriglobales bacterium]
MMGIKEVLLALVLVGVAFGISFLKKLDLEKELLIGTLRSFIQLIAVGYALELVFDLNNLWLILLVILIMVLVGGQTAGSRTKGSLKGFTISSFSIGVGTFFTLGGLLLLGVINADPKYIIPLAGMTIGNSTTASALALERMHSEMKNKKDQIEQALSLGVPSSQAVEHSFRATARAAMIPTLNLMKIVGLVQLPGAMTGMILAGASPLQAVKLQIIVVYMLICAVSIAAVITARLSQSTYFTRYHQLIIS